MTILIQRLIRGEEGAFEEVYNLYHAKVFLFAQKYVRDHHFAQEITQQVFIRIWEKRASLSLSTPIDGQIFLITRNLVIDNLRKQARDKKLEVNFGLLRPEMDKNTEDEVILADYQQKVEALIATLPPKRQQVYRMNKEQGLSFDEIAKELSISPKTVDAHLQHALKYLRRKLPELLHFFL